MIKATINCSNFQKAILCLFSFLVFISCNSQTTTYSDRAIGHDMWNTLLEKYVTADGKVDYPAFQKDTALFHRYLDLLSNNAPHPEKCTREEQLAYWINAYNAFTVKLIIDHYPLQSIKDITALNIPKVRSPWIMDFFEIGGESFNLDKIEHEILRKAFQEPRIHFAINCAAVSCPKLLNASYKADRLNEQLDKQARYFLNQSRKNKLAKNKVLLSKIFSWFKEDFTHEGSLINFLNRYAEVKIDANAEIEYLEYNWDLNE